MLLIFYFITSQYKRKESVMDNTALRDRRFFVLVFLTMLGVIAVGAYFLVVDQVERAAPLFGIGIGGMSLGVMGFLSTLARDPIDENGESMEERTQ
jgi:hypothetical protein